VIDNSGSGDSSIAYSTCVDLPKTGASNQIICTFIK